MWKDRSDCLPRAPSSYVWVEQFGTGGLAHSAPSGPADAHRGIFKVVKAVVSQNEPAPLPGLYPAT